jgi:hypothetical protein
MPDYAWNDSRAAAVGSSLNAAASGSDTAMNDALSSAVTMTLNAARATAPIAANVWSVAAVGGSSTTTIYKMRGMDAVVHGLYDCWLATGAPDFAAAQYTGALTTPLRDVVIVDDWME